MNAHHVPVRTRPPATGSSLDGTVIGWVDGRPVPRAPLERRIADLRGGPLNAALPAPGSPEDRQLARWLTQVILTEVLCEEEARALGLSPVERPPLDRLAAVELGSINAAALNGSSWVRALFEHVTASASVPTAWRAPSATASATDLFHVRHRRFASRPPASEDLLEDLGVTTLDSLPSAVAAELRRLPYGTLVGPVRDGLGWHLALAEPSPSRNPAEPSAPALQAARRQTFARWLDRLRADRVDLVPGLEHPGDPRQPDNHHKH